MYEDEDFDYFCLSEDEFSDGNDKVRVYETEDPDGDLLLCGIMRAITEENLDNVKIFAEYRCLNFTDSSYGKSPLHLAISKNNEIILDYLLAHPRIDLNVFNSKGETPLHFAIKTQKFETAKKLIRLGANVNRPNFDDVTPLHLAVPYPDLMLELVRKGAFLDQQDRSGDTPLHYAIGEECLETVCLLLYHNADANVRGFTGLTPFMKALTAKNAEIPASLLDYVVDFNAELYDHTTTLALAIRCKSPFVEQIIQGGANVNYAYGYDLVDAFSLCLKYPDAKTFKLVWDRLKYDEDDMSMGSVLFRISDLREESFKQYIDVIIESDNFDQVVESVSTADDFYMVIMRLPDFSYEHLLDQLSKLTCRLLTFGYVPNSFDMSKVFVQYGYCELFKIMLHMDIRILKTTPPDTSRIIYDVNTGMDTLLNQLVSVIRIECLHDTFNQFLDYCVYPKFIRAYLDLNRNDYVTSKIRHLPRMPSLLELSRNKIREMLIAMFNVRSSRQYFTLVNHLELSEVYKKILSFEEKLYIPLNFSTLKPCDTQF